MDYKANDFVCILTHFALSIMLPVHFLHDNQVALCLQGSQNLRSYKVAELYLTQAENYT